MAKSTKYRCTACEAIHVKWVGRCKCGQFDTLTEVAPETSHGNTAGREPARQAVSIHDALQTGRPERTKTGINELDRILDGGVVAGQVILLGGPPGVGKSTLTTTIANRFPTEETALIVSGEESVDQIGTRARRIGALSSKIRLASTNDLAEVLGHFAANQPGLLIVDSVQAIANTELSSRPGSPTQVTEVATALTKLAKETGTTTILIGQSTKDQNVAGPQHLAHLVDTVLEFSGDESSRLRTVRVPKNRYGPDSECAFFELTESGIIDVADPSGLFTTARDNPVPGTCLTVCVDGRRALISELQSLVTAMVGGNPRRSAIGLDPSRVAMLTAVTAGNTSPAINTQDVFCATVGGVRMQDPGVDLATCLAIHSSHRGLALPTSVAAFGEVSLSGDIRTPSGLDTRLAEASRFGVTHALVPAMPSRIHSLKPIVVPHLTHAVRAIDDLARQLVLSRAPTPASS